ncbi:MAG: NAD(P)H-binding protein [Rhizobiaceae bacterium]|nr:NAD(P)H-binding protein [Rhizobiaceae bacterium]
MSGKVVIFGAKGRFGRAATRAFQKAGWQVRVLARSWSGVSEGEVEQVEGNAFNFEDLIKAAEGCDVIVNALNPPYQKWVKDLPILTRNTILAAKSSGATIMIPGNVYNYGEGKPSLQPFPQPLLMNEKTPMMPTSRKGRLRLEMENTYAQTVGIRTIILRGGDFIERDKTGNWFDSQITAKIERNIIMYPGPLDRVHTWAYLPDMASALVGLAEKRDQFVPFEQFGFPGCAITGRELITQIEKVADKKLKVKSMPWGVVRVLALVMPSMWEVAEMSYLWRIPHTIDGTKLQSVLPEMKTTPLDLVLADALQGS